MTQGTTSYIEMLRKFGGNLGLPKPDDDKPIEAQKKNIEKSRSTSLSFVGRTVLPRSSRGVKPALRMI